MKPRLGFVEKALGELGVGLMSHASTATLPGHEYGEVGPAEVRRRLLFSEKFRRCS